MPFCTQQYSCVCNQTEARHWYARSIHCPCIMLHVFHNPNVDTGRPHTWQRAQANPMETAAPDVPPAVPPVAPPPPTLGMPPAPAEPKSLADQLLEAEAELEGLFGEDRLPPTVSVEALLWA